MLDLLYFKLKSQIKYNLLLFLHDSNNFVALTALCEVILNNEHMKIVGHSIIFMLYYEQISCFVCVYSEENMYDNKNFTI